MSFSVKILSKISDQNRVRELRDSTKEIARLRVIYQLTQIASLERKKMIEFYKKLSETNCGTTEFITIYCLIEEFLEGYK